MNILHEHAEVQNSKRNEDNRVDVLVPWVTLYDIYDARDTVCDTTVETSGPPCDGALSCSPSSVTWRRKICIDITVVMCVNADHTGLDFLLLVTDQRLTLADRLAAVLGKLASLRSEDA